MIKLVPERHQKELSMAIARGEIYTVKSIVEYDNIDVEAFQVRRNASQF